MHFSPSTLALTFSFKVMRVASAWISAFMAAKIHQDKYIDAVFMKKGDPPPLTGMLQTFIMLHIFFSAVVYLVVSVLAFLVMREDRAGLLKRSWPAGLDFGCEIVATSVMAAVFAIVMTKKKYFSYRYEGLRAIRAFREILVVVTAVNGLTPYFLTAPDAWK